MRKLVAILLLISVSFMAADFTPRKSKKCKENAKKLTKLRKSGALKM